MQDSNDVMIRGEDFAKAVRSIMPHQRKGHFGDVVFVKQVCRRNANKDVGIDDGLLQGAGELLGIGVLRNPLERASGLDVRATGNHNTLLVGDGGVLDAGGKEKFQHRGASGSSARHDEFYLADIFADHL